MKKRLITIALAAAMVLSVSATAFADDTTINQSSDPATGMTNVNYTVDSTYTVTIPASVTIGSGNAATVSASSVVLEEGKELNVSITGTSGDDDAFTVTNTPVSGEGSDTLTYEVADSDSTSYTLNSEVLTVSASDATAGSGASGSIGLYYTLADGNTAKYAGEYTGTMTFTVSIDNE